MYDGAVRYMPRHVHQIARSGVEPAFRASPFGLSPAPHLPSSRQVSNLQWTGRRTLHQGADGHMYLIILAVEDSDIFLQFLRLPCAVHYHAIFYLFRMDCGGLGPPPAGFKAAVRRTPSLHIKAAIGTPFDCAFGARSDRIPAVCLAGHRTAAGPVCAIPARPRNAAQIAGRRTTWARGAGRRLG